MADWVSILGAAGVGGAVGVAVNKVFEMLTKRMELKETRRRDAAEAAWRLVDLAYRPVKEDSQRSKADKVSGEIKSYYKRVYQELLEKFREE
ncbi:MAG: hypothetical protein V3U19_00800 [Thermodesulfobacteriota bacterium]